jgi:hypothetical protein
MNSRAKLHCRLRHLRFNVIVVFPEFNDRRSYLTDELQYRGGLADDVPPVGHPVFFHCR